MQTSTDIQAPFRDTLELRQQIIDACIYLSDLGFCISTWGNISVRTEEGLLITPSAVDYYTMTPADFVVVAWDGRKIDGERLPSSEMQLHRLLLLKRPDMGSVVHTHSVYASACAAANKTIPVCAEDTAQIIGGEIRCARYVPGGLHDELAEAAWEALGTGSAAVLLANHGPVALGRNLAEAVIAARVLEKTAMLFAIASSIGGCVPIPEEMVKEERRRFLYEYGKCEARD